MGYYKMEFNDEVLLDLSSDTVSSEAMLSGITAHDNQGDPIEGTIPNIGSVSGYISNYSEAFSIASGYHDGNGFVSISAPTLDPENIRKNIDILGVVGEFEGADGDYQMFIGLFSSSEYEIGTFANLSSAVTEIKNNMYTQIASNAFSDMSRLFSINFPNVSIVGQDAFANCIALENIDMPNAEYISTEAFWGCNALSYASFPKVSLIREYAFYQCHSLSSLYLGGSSVCAIRNFAFEDTPFTTSDYGEGRIYVPSSLYSDYLTDTYWSSISSKIYSY